MLQSIQGKVVEVVEFDTMPELPITGLTAGERMYKTFTQPFGAGLGLLGGTCGMITYAEILTAAIETGVISKPGKYGLHRIPGTQCWEAFEIIEK